MAEKQKNEIRTYAERGFVEYVDGYFAQIMSMKPAVDQDKKEVWELVLNPGDKLIQRYGLQQNVNGNMMYKTEIPIEMLIQLNADPSNTKWFCLLTYDGKETPATRMFLGTAQQKEILQWKEKYRQQLMRAEVAVEKMLLMENNLPKYMKKNFGAMMDQFTPMLDKLINKGRNDG